CVLNGLPGVGSLLYLVTGRHAPGLMMRFTAAEIPGIEARALATIDGLAVIANTLIAVYCATALLIVRSALARGERWALWALAGGAFALQLASYAVDALYFENKNF